MQIAGGVILGVVFTLLAIGHSGVLELLDQRDKLLKLSRDVVREHEFKGYMQGPSDSLMAMKRYLEGLK